MSRDAGFTVADVDRGLMHDPKVVALARLQGNPNTTLASIALYVAVLLESWGAGDRATIEDGTPAWLLDPQPVDSIKADLQMVGLLDAEGRIPEHAWQSWFGPAWERREQRRAAGSIGGLRSSERRSRDAVATVEQTSSNAEPDRPTVSPAGPADPSGRSEPRVAARADHKDGPSEFEAAIRRAGGVRFRSPLDDETGDGDPETSSSSAPPAS